MSLTAKHILALIVVAAMAVAFFLPFIAAGDQSLSLMAISGSEPGANYILIMSMLIVAGMLVCTLFGDVQGLLPLAFLYGVYPTFAFHRAGRTFPDVEIHGAFPPFAGAPAALGYYVLFIAVYAAIVLAVADWLIQRRRHVEVVTAHSA